MANTQDRYDTTIETRKGPTGKRVYRSLRPKVIKPNPTTDSEIIATDATRADKVAFDIYGDVQEWWRIAAVNARVDGSLYFRPGTQVIIPTQK